MRFKLMILFLFASYSISSAQFNAADPIPSFNLFPVISKDLPENFRLSVSDDLTRVMSNPARGMNSKNFIFTSYERGNRSFPGVNISNTIQPEEYTYLTRDYYPRDLRNYMERVPYYSIAGLFGTEKTKYLAELSLDYIKDDDKYNYIESTSTIGDYPYTSQNEKQNQNNYETIYKTASLKLFMIKENYAFGLSFSNSNYESAETQLEKSSRNEINFSQNSHLINIFNKENQIDADFTSYNLGVNFSYANSNTDARFSVNAQFVDQKNNSAYDSYRKYKFTRPGSDMYAESNDSTETFRSTKTHHKFTPTSIILDLYLRKEVKLLSDENNEVIFVQAKGFTSNSDGDASIISDLIEFNAMNPDVVTDTTQFYESTIDDANNRGLLLNLGYSFNKNWQDLQLLLGAQFTYTLHRAEFYNFKDSQLLKASNSTMRLLIPIYLSYNFTPHISILGGLNTGAFYYNGEIEPEYISDFVDYTYSILSVERKLEEENFYLSKMIYLATSIKHISGINLQVGFNYDLSRFVNWDVTLAYTF